MVLSDSSLVDARPPLLPRDLSVGQRWAVAGAVLITHGVVATWVWQTSQTAVTPSEAAPLMVSLITETGAPKVLQPAPPVKPQPTPRAATQPAPPMPVQRQAPPVVASTQVAKPEDFQVPVAAMEPRVAPAVNHPATLSAPSNAPVVTTTTAGAAVVAAEPPQPKTLPSSAVRFLIKPQPVYPQASKELGESGTVAMRVLVDEQGRAKEVELTKSSGYARLDRAAVAAERAARFQPYIEGGVPHMVWAPHSITFTLEEL